MFGTFKIREITQTKPYVRMISAGYVRFIRAQKKKTTFICHETSDILNTQQETLSIVSSPDFL